ncbi:MAG: 4-hydroxy-3-methylbut-2-enyl diphosphate reductase [Nitrospinota bacterium]|nr:4-hydroxy-3-methylbut-2-enyl diphosphate reductase [Nitrospinota bacterium]
MENLPEYKPGHTIDIMIEIKLAKTAGFCWGVKRAIDLTLETSRKKQKPVYTLGPLIHNPQLIELLESKKIHTINGVQGLDESEVIIRTHGVTPGLRREIKDSGHKITDATCPLVARVQGMIKKYSGLGFTIVIVGDEGHAEVVGLKGYSKTSVHVIAGPDDVSKLPDCEKVFVVAQTTCDQKKYLEAVQKLKEKFSNVEVGETICEATYERQDEVLKLADEVEMIIVVGGKNSANTTRLASIAKEKGVRVLHIETEKEISEKDLEGIKSVGVTAGASTPKWVIDSVIEKLKSISTPASGFIGKLSEGIKFLVKSNIYLSAGAVLLAYTNSVAMGIELRADILLIPFSGILSTYLVYQLLNSSQLVLSNRKKYLYHLEYKNLFWVMVAVSFVTGFYLSNLIGVAAVIIFSSVALFGAIYGFSEIGEGGVSRLSLLRAIPASKGIFSALACIAYTVAIPYLSSEEKVVVLVPFLFTLGVAYVRSVLHELRDVSGDQVFGKEVIPVILGVEKAGRMLLGVILFIGVVIVYGIVSGIPFAPLLGMSAGALYLLWFLVFGRGKGWQASLRYELFLDGQFYIIGTATIIAGLI